MNVGEMLDVIKSTARKDPEMKARFLKVHDAANPLREFCALCREYGYPIYEMELLSAGEDAYAAMRRSTNGGGENSPLLDGEDDYFEMFMADL